MPVQLIEPRRFGDDRGWFAETYNQKTFAKAGVAPVFVQDNHSLSRAPWVLRGLHFQAPPHAQAKLVRCVRGAIWDVVVDIRGGSPTWGRWVAAKLTADNGRQLYVPVGFAHGFLTLEADTEVLYKASDFYAPECESGLMWNDETLKLPWPLAGAKPVLSDKDAKLLPFAEFASPFAYDGHPLAPLGDPGP